MTSLKLSSAASRSLTYLGILLISALTRLPQLTWRSLGGDEGASLHFSDLPYSTLFTHMADLTLNRHPLFFFAFIKPWRQLTGDTDLALRTLPALIGMLTVAVVYQIGKKEMGHPRAVAATLLFALNPLIVYQHQDVRMYSPVLFLTSTAVWAALTIDYQKTRPLWIRLTIIFVTLTAAVYMHVLAVTAIPVIALLLLWRAPRRPAEALFGLVPLSLVGLAILPYFYNIFTTGTQGGGDFGFGNLYPTFLGAAKTILDFQSLLNFSGSEGLLLLILIMAVAIANFRDWTSSYAWTLWLLTSFGLIVYVIVSVQFFTTKPFSFAIIPLSFILSTAILGKNGKVNWFHGVFIGAIFLFMFAGQLEMRQPVKQQENFRAAAEFVERQKTDDDTVVIHLNWYQMIFGHYFEQPFETPLSNNVQSEEEIAEGLAPYFDSDVLWLVQAGTDAPGNGLPNYLGDQRRIVQNWLGERFPLVTEVFPAGVDVKAYALQYQFSDLPRSAAPLRVSYPNSVNLEGYRLAQESFLTADQYLHPPSTWIPVTLYWSVESPLTAGFMPTVMLEDEQGNVWGGIIERENDLRRFYPPQSWQPGEIVRWDFDIVVNPEIPAGVYKLVVRVNDAQTGTSLTHEGNENWLILKQIEMVSK